MHYISFSPFTIAFQSYYECPSPLRRSYTIAMNLEMEEKFFETTIYKNYISKGRQRL